MSLLFNIEGSFYILANFINIDTYNKGLKKTI